MVKFYCATWAGDCVSNHQASIWPEACNAGHGRWYHYRELSLGLARRYPWLYRPGGACVFCFGKPEIAMLLTCFVVKSKAKARALSYSVSVSFVFFTYGRFHDDCMCVNDDSFWRWAKLIWATDIAVQFWLSGDAEGGSEWGLKVDVRHEQQHGEAEREREGEDEAEGATAARHHDENLRRAEEIRRLQPPSKSWHQRCPQSARVRSRLGRGAWWQHLPLTGIIHTHHPPFHHHHPHSRCMFQVSIYSPLPCPTLSRLFFLNFLETLFSVNLSCWSSVNLSCWSSLNPSTHNELKIQRSCSNVSVCSIPYRSCFQVSFVNPVHGCYFGMIFQRFDRLIISEFI